MGPSCLDFLLESQLKIQIGPSTVSQNEQSGVVVLDLGGVRSKKKGLTIVVRISLAPLALNLQESG